MSSTAQPTRIAKAQAGQATDVRVVGAELYLLPVETRVPLKFGPETLTSVTCARVRLKIRARDGRTACGWGETPLSVQWAWPSTRTVAERHEAMVRFCIELVAAWSQIESWGHPLEVGDEFLQTALPQLRARFNNGRDADEQMPYLAALICNSAFDIALHDAYGVLHNVPVYETYNANWMNRDLSTFLEPASDSAADFRGKYPADFLHLKTPSSLPAWHLVGGLDALELHDVKGSPINDGFPVALTDWIERDGLHCLKIKLRGNDAAWDYDRLLRVGAIALSHRVEHLSADFNCTVTDPAYVNQILDRLADERGDIYNLLLYIEQPFPYELEEYPIDVTSVSTRKPLFMDESAHDWRQIRLGRSLGWTGVALKTCKTQTGAILSLCWAKAHNMQLMVQDLTNPMLAQIPHVLLAAHADTIMGVETNAMQFYPQASTLEATVHPGIYTRTHGCVNLETIVGSGLGYNGAERARQLPPPVLGTVA